MVRSDEHAHSQTLDSLRVGAEPWDCAGEVWQVGSASARELFVRCYAPEPKSTHGSGAAQAERLYACLPQILDRVGARLCDVVWERAFFRDLANDLGPFQSFRGAAYRQADVSAEQMPLISLLQQPPCLPGRALELQAYVVVPTTGQSVQIETIPTSGDPSSGEVSLPAAKLLEIDGFRHLYAAGFAGQPEHAAPCESFADQCDSMFNNAGHMLRRHARSFRDVLRTWCYLIDIDRDYDAFNASRNDFFRSEAIQRLPASTGIGAGLYPPGNRCGMDLYALLNPDGATIEIMHASTLNEAPEYGSSFSRGMKLGLPGKTILYISGTASVDEDGATVHIDDAQRQIDRMLLNVQELLTPQAAQFGDVVQAITYLKSADYLDRFQQALPQYEATQMPNSIVVADVCRPDLLCEIEMIAVLPADESTVKQVLRFGR